MILDMNNTISGSQFLQKLKKIQKQDLLDIHGIGEVLADNLTNFVQSPRYLQLIEKFQELESNNRGVSIVHNQSQLVEGSLSGEVICITGSFEQSRSVIKELLESKGAKVIDSITKKTTLLLAGQNSGSKLDKAKKLGIKVIFDYENL